MNKDPGAEETFKTIGEAYEVCVFVWVCVLAAPVGSSWVAVGVTSGLRLAGDLRGVAGCACVRLRPLVASQAVAGSQLTTTTCPVSSSTFVENQHQVLSDDNKRAIYDKFGEAGLKGDAFGGMGGMGGFQAANPMDIFESFFGALLSQHKQQKNGGNSR